MRKAVTNLIIWILISGIWISIAIFGLGFAIITIFNIPPGPGITPEPY